MRVAVEHKDGSVSAYRFGRVIEGHHNLNVLTGEQHPVEDVLNALADQARREFPEAKVRIQKLVDNGDDTSTWVDVDNAEAEAEAGDES